MPRLPESCYGSFLLELDIFQLVFQLGCVGAPEHMFSFGKFYVEREVVVKGLRV